MVGCAGKHAEAEQVHREVLEARQRVLGPEHPDTLRSMNNLGTALQDQGKAGWARGRAAMSMLMSCGHHCSSGLEQFTSGEYEVSVRVTQCGYFAVPAVHLNTPVYVCPALSRRD
jgi:hypothetical protein